ncbi:MULTISPECIES: hypothetical protein [unclassified Nonomuraea]|uniref:hypothetical protein n=1 Tax=unclassified Nonomuraea TaxID=2593643 RepID=UPI00340EE105
MLTPQNLGTSGPRSHKALPWIVIAKAVRRYVVARKRTHLAVTACFAAAEVAAVFLTHEVSIHLSLTGGIAAWESLVISLGE